MFLFISNAHAQWIYEGDESAFGDSNSLKIAMTGNYAYGFGFRCQFGEIEATFITPDKSLDSETVKNINLLDVYLLYRVDDNKPYEIDASLFLNDGAAQFEAKALPEMIDDLIGAKRKVSVAIKMFDKIFHEQTFSAKYSTSVGVKFKENCNLSD